MIWKELKTLTIMGWLDQTRFGIHADWIVRETQLSVLVVTSHIVTADE